MVNYNDTLYALVSLGGYLRGAKGPGYAIHLGT